MKTIKPVSVWFNGNEVQATVLASNCTYDNLFNSATFNYQLLQVIVNPENPYLEQLNILTNGNLLMDGEVYQAWETNDYAYDWIAQQLNLTITGNYVPPVPPTPTTTSTTTESHNTTTTTTTTEV
jgi:hypothetical protein